MKNIILSIIYSLAATFACFSQELSPQIVASSGGTYERDGIILSWTLGETVTETYTTGDVILTQGFHQPEIMVTANNNTEIPGVEAKVYPNPAGDFINIDINTKEVKKITIELFSLDGEKILLRNDYVIDQKNQFFLEDIPPGTYILKIIFMDKTKSYKIIKM